MLRPLFRWVLWLCLAAWFASGVGGLATPAERLTYAQVRALARLTPDLAPDRRLLGENGAGPLPLRERPGAALAALPFYALGRWIGGIVHDDAADPLGVAAQTTGLAAAAAAATALTLLGLIAVRLGVHPAAALTTVILLAVGSPLTAYGSRLAPPIFGVLAVALAVYSLLQLREKDERLLPRLLLGAGLGLMFLLDDAMLLLLPAMLLWAASRARQLVGRPSWAIAFLPPFLAGALLFFAVNATAWGSPFAAPDSLSLGVHFWREYGAHATSLENFVFHRLAPGAGFWLFQQGTVSESLAFTRQLPAELRGRVFLGLFAWFPLLAAGWLGAFAMRGNDALRLPLRLLGIGFWLAVGLRAAAAHFADPAHFDAAALLPFCCSMYVGLSFFLDYHLVVMPGLIWKNLLRLAFLGALTVSLANGWWDAAAAAGGAPPHALTALIRAPGAPPLAIGAPYGPLPASIHDAFFLNLDRAARWIRRDPVGFFAALRPGLNNAVLFVPLLWALAVLPALAATLARRVLRRRAADSEGPPAAPGESPAAAGPNDDGEKDRPAEKGE